MTVSLKRPNLSNCESWLHTSQLVSTAVYTAHTSDGIASWQGRHINERREGSKWFLSTMILESKGESHLWEIVTVIHSEFPPHENMARGMFIYLSKIARSKCYQQTNAVQGIWLSAYRGDSKEKCIDFSVNQTGRLVFGTDDENQLCFSWKPPAAVCDGLPVNAADFI